MAVQTPRIMSTSSRVRPAGKTGAACAASASWGGRGPGNAPRPAPIPNGPGRPAPLRWRPVPRRARVPARSRRQQGRALVDQQRVAQFPGGQLQRLGHVQRAVLGIGRDVADAVAQRDLGVGEPGFLGAQHDGRHAFGGLSQVRAGQIGRLADVAGRGPGRAPAPSARRPASPGPAPLPAWRRRGRSPARRRRRWTGPRPPGAGSRPRYGGHQHQFREPHGLDRPGGRADVAGVAGVHHDETGAGKRRRRAGFGGAETPSEEGDLPSRTVRR